MQIIKVFTYEIPFLNSTYRGNDHVDPRTPFHQAQGDDRDPQNLDYPCRQSSNGLQCTGMWSLPYVR